MAGGGTGDAGVSDVVGSILLVAMTVIAAAGFGVLLLSFEGPPDRVHVDVEMRTSPGADGAWDTGDERLEVVHLGGEDLEGANTVVAYTADGDSFRYTGSSLASAFADGLLTIGEVWTSPAAAADYLTVAQDEAVQATLATGSEIGELVAAGTVTGGGIVLSTATTCAPDVGAPTVSLSHSPSDLTTAAGTGSVTVTAVASDACGDVDTSVAPTLWYRITPGPLPGPSSFTSLGSMSYSGGSSNTWTRTIPAPTGGWTLAWGQELQFYVAGVRDTASSPNTLFQSSTRSDEVNLIGDSSFADYPAAVAGVFQSAAPFPNVQADDGNYAQIVEACTNGAPVSNAQGLCGTTAGGVSVTSSTLAIRSDDARSSMTGSGTAVHVTGFDVPQATQATLSSFTISLEAQRGGGGSTNPTVQLEYQFSSACSGTWTAAGATFSVSGTSDSPVTRAVTTGAPFDIAEIESLCVRARVTNSATRALLTDALTVTVAYPGSTTTYDLNTEFGWSGLSVGVTSTGLLELDYRVATGEAYTVQKFNGASWTSCAGSLDSTTGSVFQCLLTTAELQSGSPLVRVTGTADSGAPSTFQVDYVRVAVFT